MTPSLAIREKGFQLEVDLVPWDTEVFNFPIAHITALIVEDITQANLVFDMLHQWVRALDVRMISCRLPHEQLRETFLLEQQGFRFIEMVLHPVMENLQKIKLPDSVFHVSKVPDYEVGVIQNMAETCFSHERFHMDPRLSTELANVRYGRWVKNTIKSNRQLLLKIENGNEILAFFVIEENQDRGVYWHLTAVAPEFQGKGHGRNVWLAMLAYHQANGIEQVSTTISARNTPVLSLYSQLQFRFTPPEMTFHWMAE